MSVKEVCLYIRKIFARNRASVEKNPLSLLSKSAIAISLLIVGTSTHAVHVNTDGAGQVALLPFYNVNNNFITNITITNTTNLYKAVKVRFHESRIGADVFDFNVYLAPYDVWNATLRRNGTSGLPNLITEDETCTYPDNTDLKQGIDFNDAYTATTTDDLTQGSVEIIEMGVIADGDMGPAEDGGLYAEIDVDGCADGIIHNGDRPIIDGLRHDATGVPNDCTVIADAWRVGQESAQVNGFESGSLSVAGVAEDVGGANEPYADSINAGLVAPTGGIKVYSILIDVSTGAAFVQQAVHIDHYTTVAQHYRPDDLVNSQLPSLASGNVQRANMLSADGNTVKSIDVPLTEYDTGSLFDISPNPSIPMGSNPLPIALILSADSVVAPYFVEPEIGGETDIILNFPMRKHGIWNREELTNDLDGNVYGSSPACVGDLYDDVNDGRTVLLEAVDALVNDYPHDASGNHCANAGYRFVGGNVEIALYYYDYSENAGVYNREPPFDSPITPISPEYVEDTLSRAVNVVSVNRAAGDSRSVFGTSPDSTYEWQLDTGFLAGWVNISFDRHYDYESISTMTEVIGGIGAEYGEWTGVPVIGFAAMSAELGPYQLGEVIELYRGLNRN